MTTTDNLDIDNAIEGSAVDSNNFQKELFKKWFKTSSQSGFISLTPAFNIGKVKVDIGKLGENNSVSSATECWINAVNLLTYLTAVSVTRTASALYPSRAQCPSPESFVAFGGSKDVSRVFKIHHWGAKKDNPGDINGFAWKCGHFEGKTTASGAIEPQWDKVISTDMIKISRLEMLEIQVRLSVALGAFASNSDDWMG